MDIITLPIKDIKPYKNNPRVIDDNAIDKVSKSIKEFGFKVPIIVDKDNVIVAGHTRLKAAEKLKIKTVPCIIADDLTDEQIKAFRLADNKVSEFSDWDFDLLDLELKDIDFDMSCFGFDKDFEEIEAEENEVPAEIEFTESLEEKHNYIVLYFDTDIDWLQAETLFNIKTVKGLSTRKDGKGESNKGIGRVLNGAEALNKIIGSEWNASEN